MKIIFAGSGSAFTVGANNYHCNFVIETTQKKRLLVDCGTDARLSLYEIGLGYADIDDVFISHLHADHAGGLEWLGFTTYFDINCKKANLYIHEKLVKDLWQNDLSGAMKSLPKANINLETYFNLKIIKDKFTWEGIDFEVIPVEHVKQNPTTYAPCFGLFFKINNTQFLYTADTRHNPNQLNPYYKVADIIFHDCELTDSRSNVHPNYRDLLTLDKSIRAKMWLIHYNPLPLPPAIKRWLFRVYETKTGYRDINLSVMVCLYYQQLIPFCT